MARPDEINDTPSIPTPDTNVPSIPAPDAGDPDRNEHEDDLQNRNGGVEGEEARFPGSQEAKKFTEEELAQRLKDIKDINELKKVLEDIIGSMEEQLMKVLQEIGGEDAPSRLRRYEGIGILDEDASDEESSLFEKKGMEILNQAKDLLAQIEQGNAEVNLLTFLQQASSELYQTQNQAEEYLRTDLKDGDLTFKAFSSRTSMEVDYSLGGGMLFFSHSNPNKFRELLNSKSTGRLIGEVFSISEGAGAFNDGYAEIKKRLNGKNIFDEIDDIAADGHDRNLDWTADFLENQAVRGMLNNGKIEDLDKYLSTYKDAERIKNNMRKELRKNIMDATFGSLDSDSFLADFLKHFNEVKKSPELGDIAKELEETSPTIRNFNQMEAEVHQQQPDILRDGTVDGLIVFDNDDLEGSGAEYFKPNIAKFKRQGYKEIEHKNSPDMEKVVLQKGNDKLTLARLKEVDSENKDESYDRALNELKEHGYNLFALRGHCYNTCDIATRMGNIGMVSEGSIFIDGGCGNARHTDKYINGGINCPIFSYTSTGKGATTEALVDIILREKNKKGNLGTLLSSINQGMNGNSPTLKWIKTMNMPDSPYTLYSLAKHRTNRDYASVETKAGEPGTGVGEINPIDSEQIAMNTESEEAM